MRPAVGEANVPIAEAHLVDSVDVPTPSATIVFSQSPSTAIHFGDSHRRSRAVGHDRSEK